MQVDVYKSWHVSFSVACTHLLFPESSNLCIGKHQPKTAEWKKFRVESSRVITTSSPRMRQRVKDIYHQYLELRGLNTSSLVLIVNDLNITLATHDNGALAMDGIRNNVKDSLDLALKHACRGNAASLLGNHGHGNALVQTAKLALGGLIVGRVEENASVEEGAVDIGNHRTDVAGRVRLGTLLEDGNGLFDGLVPVVGVALVACKDGLAAILGELHVDTSVDELTNGGVEAEPMDSAALEGEDKLDGRTVDTVTSADAFSPRPEKIIDGSLGSFLLFENTENGTDRDVAVNVTGSVERIEGDAELASLLLGDDDGLLLLFRNEDGANSRVDKGVDHHVIGHNVELLLVVAGTVHLTCKAIELSNTCPLHGRGNELAGGTDSVEKDHKLVITSVGHYEPIEGRGVLSSPSVEKWYRGS